MNLTDSRLAQGGCEKLDMAILSFFEQFRKVYVGDQVQKTSKVVCPYFYHLLLPFLLPLVQALQQRHVSFLLLLCVLLD